MKLFSRNKKNTRPKTADKTPDWNEDFKANATDKTHPTETTQQGLTFTKNVDLYGSNVVLGTKQGLSINFEKINQDQIDILKKCQVENTAAELKNILKRSNKTKFKKTILDPLIEGGFFELTLPDKPTSPKQKYRLTGLFVERRTKP